MLIECFLLPYLLLSPSRALPRTFQHPWEGAGSTYPFQRSHCSDSCVIGFAQLHSKDMSGSCWSQAACLPSRLESQYFPAARAWLWGGSCGRPFNKKVFFLRVHLRLISLELGWIIHAFTWIRLYYIKTSTLLYSFLYLPNFPLLKQASSLHTHLYIIHSWYVRPWSGPMHRWHDSIFFLLISFGQLIGELNISGYPRTKWLVLNCYSTESLTVCSMGICVTVIWGSFSHSDFWVLYLNLMSHPNLWEWKPWNLHSWQTAQATPEHTEAWESLKSTLGLYKKFIACMMHPFLLFHSHLPSFLPGGKAEGLPSPFLHLFLAVCCYHFLLLPSSFWY